MIKIHTDGACSGNPGKGGWGLVISKEEEVLEVRGGFAPETTNNRMELQAAIEALEYAQNLDNIKVYTDSKYVKDGITSWIESWKKNGWQTSGNNSVKNQDLWQKLDKLNSDKIQWFYVPGHSGVKMNEIADEVATNMIEYNDNDEEE